MRDREPDFFPEKAAPSDNSRNEDSNLGLISISECTLRAAPKPSSSDSLLPNLTIEDPSAHSGSAVHQDVSAEVRRDSSTERHPDPDLRPEQLRVAEEFLRLSDAGDLRGIDRIWNSYRECPQEFNEILQKVTNVMRVRERASEPPY